MSATTDGDLKATIETEYAPVEDNTFAEVDDEAANTGYAMCYYTNPDMMPEC